MPPIIFYKKQVKPPCLLGNDPMNDCIAQAFHFYF